MSHENNGQSDVNPPNLSKAEQDLERAEAHLAKARSEEQAAEREIAEALDELKEVERKDVTVHVVHVTEAEKASFEEPPDATLAMVWDKAYVKLGIPREPKDVFQTGGPKPKSLMNDLGLTLHQAHERHVIENYHFGIASETGGA